MHATVREWTDVVRRARIPRTAYAVALTYASYADSDGSRVFPGAARVAYDAKVSYNVAVECTATLRELGLLELVRPAQSRGDAHEYRLTLPDDGRLAVPSPTEARTAINALAARRRGKWQTKRVAGLITEGDLLPGSCGAGLISDEAPATRIDVPNEAPATRIDVPNTDLLPAPLAPTKYLPTDLVTTPTPHSEKDLRTTVTVTSAPRKCEHGLRVVLRVDGSRQCPLCRRELQKDNLAQVIPMRRPA